MAEQNIHALAALHEDNPIIERQIEATIALAYEQRTANLIAYMQGVETAEGQSIKINGEAARSVFEELNRRLDRPTKPVPKTFEERIAFEQDWDAKVEAGRKA